MKNILVGQSEMHIANVLTGQPVVSKCCSGNTGREGEMNTLWGNQGGRSAGTGVKGWGQLNKYPEVTWYEVRLAVRWFRGR